MKLQNLIEAKEMLEYAEENLLLCIAEIKNELILDGLSPYDYIIARSYKEAAGTVTVWRNEVKRISAMPLEL